MVNDDTSVGAPIKSLYWPVVATVAKSAVLAFNDKPSYTAPDVIRFVLFCVAVVSAVSNTSWALFTVCATPLTLTPWIDVAPAAAPLRIVAKSLIVSCLPDNAASKPVTLSMAKLPPVATSDNPSTKLAASLFDVVILSCLPFKPAFTSVVVA